MAVWAQHLKIIVVIPAAVLQGNDVVDIPIVAREYFPRALRAMASRLGKEFSSLSRGELLALLVAEGGTHGLRS